MKKRNIKIALLLLGGLAAGNPALRAAEQDATDGSSSAASNQAVSREELDGVRSEIASLQERLDRTYERNTAQTLRPLFVTGIAQLRYSQQESRYNSTLGNTGDHQGGFSLNALILNFQGNLKRDFEEGRNINYLFSLVTPGGMTVGANTATWDYAVKPLDAYISYHLRPSLDPEGSLLQVIVGQQKKPFGLEALAAEDKKPTILSAQSARPNLAPLDAGLNTGTFPSNGLGLDTRDIGVVVKGDLFPQYDAAFRYRVAAVEYQLGVFNGSGPNALDNNGVKDIAGRLVLNAPVDYSSIFRGLSVGSSYYNGKSYSTAAAALGNTDVKRWGADIAYVNTPIGFTYEYVHGQDNLTKKQGQTLTVFYNIGEQFVTGYKYQDRYDDWYPTTIQPFVRFDWWDSDTSKTDNVTEITTIGLNWFLAQTTKLQLNYNIVNLGKTPAAAYDGPRNQLLAQVQYTF
ncbi:MAG: hypothetical protein HGB04_02070 [Chlorobiaceae bacterium]|nr:hypothetical protein [Chlorobiaceae bacterium]